MLMIIIKKKNGAYYSHSKLSDIIFIDMYAARTQFIDGLGINTDHKPY